MEEDGNSSSNSSKIKKLDTGKADRAVWLMKCPLIGGGQIMEVKITHIRFSASLQSYRLPRSSPPRRTFIPRGYFVSKSLSRFTMEMAANDVPNMPKSYSLNMFKDFVPMCVFSESNQGEDHNLYFISILQVIDNDRGVHMRPMPGMQFLKEILNALCVYNKRGANQGTYELKPEYKKSVEDTSAE
ncbi:hypothetical protein LguiB_020138 [Lonicera macranthoides]